MSVQHYFRELQDAICKEVCSYEPHSQFLQDDWQREEGGGGITRIITGDVVEKGGVNYSHVMGAQLPATASAARPELAGRSFQAVGVSVVLHPTNPYVPTVHANWRFFTAQKEQHAPIWWFGGGFDLTPYYGFEEDCKHWHCMAQQACLPYGEDVYPRFKAWCDQYFYLKHRKEPRGIGGLFFDDLNAWGFEKTFAFIKRSARYFLLAYSPILHKRKTMAFTQREKNFQLYRRGRYVEFNLVYDRGTLFGLQSDGRTESILMSLPPEASWRYNWQPDYQSEEAKLYQDYLIQRDWL